MKWLFAILFVFLFGLSKAGNNPNFFILPENPFQDQSITIGIWLGYSTCDALIVEGNGILKKNFIVEGNTIKLLVYSENLSFCPPIVPIPTIQYSFGSLGFPAGDYTLELYILNEGTPFPLPSNFVLNLVDSLQFQILAPIIIPSTTKLSLLISVFLLLIVGYKKIQHHAPMGEKVN